MPTADAEPSRKDIILSELSAALEIPECRLNLQSSFIENGGNSMSSIRLQAALRNHGIQLSVDSIFMADTLLRMVEFGQVCPSRKSEDIWNESPEHCASNKRTRMASLEPHSKRPRRLRHGSMTTKDRSGETLNKYRMTEMQVCLAQATQMDPSRCINVISYLETHRPDRIPALKRAWEKVLESESIFRMSFELDEMGGYMCEGKDVPLVWEEITVNDEASYFAELESFSPPDLPFRSSFKVITLIPNATETEMEIEGESTVIWRVHHAMIDAFSCGLVLSKVQRVLEGTKIQPDPSYVDFSKKLHQIQQQGHDIAVKFWKRQREEHPSPATELTLPTPASSELKFITALQQVHAHCNHESLAAHSKEFGVTMASLYYAAWGLVLARYADSDDVSFGVVLSGRGLPIEGVQSVIGPTINTLPLHVSLDGRMSIQEYSHTVFSSLIDLTSFQWTTLAHGFSRGFASAVNIRLDVPGWTDTKFGPLDEPRSQVLTDVPIHVEILDRGRICISYNKESFYDSHMKRLGAAYVAVLNSMSQSHATVASCLESTIGRGQRVDLASMGNCASDTTRQLSVDDDLVSLFTRTARANPSAVALERASRIVTYAELDEQSSVAASHLSEHIEPGDTVCVHADGSINWIIAIYAVLKSGAIYCPLDAALPDAVRATNFTTTTAKLFLTGDTAAKLAKPSSCGLHFSVEELLTRKRASTITDTVTNKLSWLPPRPNSAAYLCFTSGSTGRPKGVLCRHEGLVAFQKQLEVRLGARLGWRIAQFMSPGFDGSIHEIFSALSYGATLVLKDTRCPFDHLKTCDAAVLTPSVAKALDVADFPRLEAVYLVGEAVPQSVCDAWAASRRLYNMYGPTEATCGATIKKLTANKPVTLGVPNPSTRVYILDTRRRLVPWGIPGEIYLAGVQVASGYVGRPDETQQRFLPDSVNPQYEGEYMYKTGDRALWDERGELVFLGRRDRQIKLRGLRIDLDDLEIRMTRAYEKCIATAVVLSSDECLIALVQPASLDLDHFKSQIRKHIPSFAIPSHIVAIDEFPTTPIGKLDYKVIAAMSEAGPDTGTKQDTPLSPSELVISAALRHVLNLPIETSFDLESSFSDLGGDSVRALSLSHRLSRLFKRRVPVRSILNSATVGCLARELADIPAMQESPRRGNLLGDHGVSSIEKEWWQKYQHAGLGTSSFNVSYACRFVAPIDRGRLVLAWNSVFLRHRILTCRFKYSDLHELVREYSEKPATIEEVETIDMHRELNIPFKLDSDELVRVSISPEHMLVMLSHIICDLTSLKIMLQDVADIYNGKEMIPVTKQYTQTEWSMPRDLDTCLQFWTEYLAASSGTYYGSFGSSLKKRQTWSGLSYACQVSSSIHNAMLRFATATKVTMHQLALGAVALALTCNTGTCDITLGGPYLNRNSEDDLGVVGLFLEPLPIRIQYPEPLDIGQVLSNSPRATESPGPSKDAGNSCFIKTVQRASRAALSHAVPWDRLLSYLKIQPDFPNHPVFDVMVTFHDGDGDVDFHIGDGVEALPTWSDGAKFKLMVEFTARRNGTLDLRLEYSDECFTPEEVQLIARLVIESLDGLTTGDGYDAIVDRLRSLL